VQAGTCFHSLASTTQLPARANRVRMADRPHCTMCLSALVHASCFKLVLAYLGRRTLITMLSEIAVELTSQTVVFAFFFCRGATIGGALQPSTKQGLRVCGSSEKKTSLGDCGAGCRIKPRWPFPKSHPAILMVQSAQDRTTDNASRVFGGARYRRVLVQ
jgi:hypothetical protein